jgi:hypothetical protein
MKQSFDFKTNMNPTKRNTYKIFASNGQGASIKIAPDRLFTTVASAQEAAHSNMDRNGKGWHIAIVDRYGEVVISFTIL